MKHIILPVAEVFGTSMFSSGANAADSNGGTILNIFVQQEGAALFQVSNISGSWPSCATSSRFVINTTTPAGQALFSTLLSALKAHTPVNIHGKGVCDIWGDSESVEYIEATS